MASRPTHVVANTPQVCAAPHRARNRARPALIAAAACTLALAIPASAAPTALQLSNPRAVTLPGVTLDKDDKDGRIRGADFDPRTGHLWLIGEFVVPDPLEPGEVDPVDVVEYDPIARTTLRTLNVRSTQAFGGNNGFPHSLAVHPTTGNLFVGWFQQVSNAADHGGFAEFTPAGALVSNGDRGNDFLASGATFDASGKLVLVHVGGELYRFDAATRALLSTEPLHDTFPGQNYVSADVDPVTGRLVLSGTNSGIVEFDPDTLNALATLDETPFLPPPGPLMPIHGRVDALAFNLTGDQVYLGGDFGLLVLDRAVPEPSTALIAAAAITLLRLRRPRRPR